MVLVGRPEGKRLLGRARRGWKMILKGILEKLPGREWTELICFRRGTDGRLEEMQPYLQWLCPMVLLSWLLTNLSSGCLENRPGKIRKDKRHKTVVGIQTRYELIGQEIESRWGRDLSQPSRPVLGPTQPPIQWLPGLSWG